MRRRTVWQRPFSWILARLARGWKKPHDAVTLTFPHDAGECQSDTCSHCHCQQGSGSRPYVSCCKCGREIAMSRNYPWIVE